MVKIGIIGSPWIEDLVKQRIKKFPSFRPVFKSSNNIFDAPKFTKELSEKCDILLYSGYIPYSISKKNIPYNLPAHFIPIKGASLYRAFYLLRKKITTIKTVSIDTLTEKDIDDLNNNLDESITSIHYDSKLSLEKTEAIVTFHEELYKSNKTQCALTGLKIVSDALTIKGVPNKWIVPTDGDIVVALERALLATEQRINLESQIVFGIIHFDNFEQLQRQITSEQKTQRLQLDIHRVILDYVEELDGYLTSLGGNEYMFVTTRGTFERVSQGYKYFPLITDIEKQFKVNISVGVGFGTTANEAGLHARMALLQSIDHGGKKCFIVKEDRSVIGPIENIIPLTYPLNITNKSLIKQAEKSSVSPYYLGKVISILKRKNAETFTANELASSLGITTRSANRMLVNWLDAGIVKIIGIEKLQTRGRPRQVYKLLLKDKSLLSE